MPVQRAVPVHHEPVNNVLRQFYEGLLKITSKALFREGRLNVLYSNNPAFISYVRVDETSKAIVIINTSNQLQKGSVTLVPGLHLKAGTSYELRDLFYDLKSPEVKRRETVIPTYRYTASHLITQGLYVELAPFDAHIFLIETRSGAKFSERVAHALRALNDGLPIPQPVRKILGPVLMRSSDPK
jgi:hypothetical protein